MSFVCVRERARACFFWSLLRFGVPLFGGNKRPVAAPHPHTRTPNDSVAQFYELNAAIVLMHE